MPDQQHSVAVEMALPIAWWWLVLIVILAVLLIILLIILIICIYTRSVYTYAYTLSGGSVAEWLACWTEAQKGLGSNRSRDAVG